MRNARREKPQIAHTDIINKISSLRVDRGDARPSIEHVSPLRGLVPMQFTYSTGVQTHVHAGDILRDAELTGGHLTGPAARLQPHMRVGKREAKIGQSAMVGGRRHQDIRVLAVSRNVSRAGIRAAMAGTLGRGTRLHNMIVVNTRCDCCAEIAAVDGVLRKNGSLRIAAIGLALLWNQTEVGSAAARELASPHQSAVLSLT